MNPGLQQGFDSIWLGMFAHFDLQSFYMEPKTAVRGANRTVFSTFKVTIPCACQRRLCFFKAQTFYPKSAGFFKESGFTTVLEPFVGQFHFLPSHLRLLFQLLGSTLAARSPCCALSATAIAARRPSNLC